jgi:hypothetical protein
MHPRDPDELHTRQRKHRDRHGRCLAPTFNQRDNTRRPRRFRQLA